MGDIEELVDTVLVDQHPKMRQRCIVDRIVSVFEDSFGAYDVAGVTAVLELRERSGLYWSPSRRKILRRLRRALISICLSNRLPRFLILPKESGPISPANF